MASNHSEDWSTESSDLSPIPLLPLVEKSTRYVQEPKHQATQTSEDNDLIKEKAQGPSILFRVVKLGVVFTVGYYIYDLYSKYDKLSTEYQDLEWKHQNLLDRYQNLAYKIRIISNRRY